MTQQSRQITSLLVATLVAVALAPSLLVSAGAAAPPTDSVRIVKGAREFLQQRMFPGGDVRLRLGHFFYATDSEPPSWFEDRRRSAFLVDGAPSMALGLKRSALARHASQAGR